MISAPASQICSAISESIIIHVHGEERPDYAITQAAMMSVIFSLLLVWTACGNEERGSHFELAGVAGALDATTEKERALEENDDSSIRDTSGNVIGEVRPAADKHQVEMLEKKASK